MNIKLHKNARTTPAVRARIWSELVDVPGYPGVGIGCPGHNELAELFSGSGRASELQTGL